MTERPDTCPEGFQRWTTLSVAHEAFRAAGRSLNLATAEGRSNRWAALEEAEERFAKRIGRGK